MTATEIKTELVYEPPKPKVVETIEEGEGPFVIIVEDKRFGDKRLKWNPKDPASLKKAKKFFEDRLAEGKLAYKLGKKGVTDGDIIDKFDPTAERIFFIGRQVGG
jgi:hypothetical protein